MNLSIISFTEKGRRLSERTAHEYSKHSCDLSSCMEVKQFVKSSKTAPAEGQEVWDDDIASWAYGQMEAGNILLFIGACGIAVRAIAPFIKDKTSDSPVLVMDEDGRYIIPILSGHIGGANELAVTIGAYIGAIPVITTATDLRGSFAVDIFAKRNGLKIFNKEGIAAVSSKVLAGEAITISIDGDNSGCIDPLMKKETGDDIRLIPYPPEDEVDILITSGIPKCSYGIWLIPCEYVIGMGCRKDKDPAEVEAFIEEMLNKFGIRMDAVYALASIDKKKDEEAFVSWSRKNDIPFVTYSAGRLGSLTGDFRSSEFVMEQVGVDNVCERAALAGCEGNGSIFCNKTARDGMTIAIAKREWRVTFDE
ncbi:MAG: cobalamin biosynthesis protein [Lachnospiraceae bacterium]|nr:cobalamin biosynthesis protein [Lachnospiraceae bacterium]